MVEQIKQLFPALGTRGFRVTSPPDEAYNCIAWAAGSTTICWWPADPKQSHWPTGVPRKETIEAFRDAFGTLGYTVCADDGLEGGFEKIAIFADRDAVPQHAARQLPGGQWTSKLGKLEDIEHELRGLEGEAYGSVALIMKRPVVTS